MGHILETFWEDLWKISYPRKECAFSERRRKIFGKCSEEDIRKGCAFSKLLWKNLWKNLERYL